MYVALIAFVASSSSTFTLWLFTGTGWFDMRSMSINRQPFGAYQRTPMLIVVARAAVNATPPGTTWNGELSSVHVEPTTWNR